MNTVHETTIVICPKHGEHEYAIESTIPGHEGVWCQICWIESLGSSLPYKKGKLRVESCSSTTKSDFQTMEEMIPVPEAGWMPMPRD